MVAAPARGPAELVLMASVARRHFLDGHSKVEIAEEFGISRFKVARLLDTALTSGVVRIEIAAHGDIDVDLSDRLRNCFGLTHALVVDTAEEDLSALRRCLGQTAAELASEIVGDGDVLGLAWARSVHAMTSQLTTLPRVPVVQLTGALSRPDMDESSVDLVRDVARITRGPAYVFYAPMIMPDATSARTLRRQREVVKAFDQFPSVTKAFVGIGHWSAGASTLFDAMTEEERAHLAERGVIGDVSGVFVSAKDKPVRGPISKRIVAIDYDAMRAIPEVIAIPYGRQKAPAVRAAIGSGLVNGLVTHGSLARALLDR
ncbi:MAG TPA: sugar-binding domain-containing protein [Segeticoccus sp.]|uniref:sugar-binding transcriptional regulator n=1 Tax=Segeticoccus sp. TaxID=2706531 RepID=UPI002D7E3633|nr:sugar-binding domain-containing protein [Segeticoccus sp.]HET8601402.1 sugar-binding domain-containing protein [Segeticoccus sp.]